MSNKQDGKDTGVKECSVCGQPGQRTLDGVSGDHQICNAITDLRLDALTIEARFVEWRKRQASATGQLLERVAVLEDGGLAELTDIEDGDLEKRCENWAEKHQKEDVDNMVRVLQRLGYGWTSKRQGDDNQ